MFYHVSYENSLSIYDGGSTSPLIIGKYCSYHADYVQSIRPKHISSGNEMVLHLQYSQFYTSSSSTFEIEYNITGKLV